MALIVEAHADIQRTAAYGHRAAETVQSRPSLATWTCACTQVPSSPC